MRSVRFAMFAVTSMLLASAASAQQVAVPKTTVISIQPLSAMYSVYAGEVEHAIAPAWTLGLGASHWSPDFGGIGFTYTSADLKVKYYPDEHALRGFSFGGQAGYTHIRTRDDITSDGSTRKTTVGGPTVGVALDYNWLLGPPQAFYIGLGIGAKKIFASTDGDNEATFGYPTTRISIGFAF
jgi:hypothetical protein